MTESTLYSENMNLNGREWWLALPSVGKFNEYLLCVWNTYKQQKKCY